MKTVRIHKAQRFSAGTVVESVTIELHDELPYDERSESQVTVQERFASDAKALRDALRCLPGGTADQLLRLLLEDRASLLVVPRPVEGQPPEDDGEPQTEYLADAHIADEASLRCASAWRSWYLLGGPLPR